MRLRCDPCRLLSDLMACAQGERLSNGNVRLLLASFPRSGSSLLGSTLEHLPGFQKVSLVPAYGRREQELALEWLLATHQSFGNYVARHHVRYSEHTERLLGLFGLQPIVLVRNIFDVVVSLRDYLKTGAPAIPQAGIPAALPSWADERIDHFITDLLIPWFLNFYVSWTECPHRIQVTYEALLSNPMAVVRKITHWAGLTTTQSEIASAVAIARGNPSLSNLNVGTPGRGRELTPTVVNRIEALAAYYSDVDFEPIGISSWSTDGSAQPRQSPECVLQEQPQLGCGQD